MALRLIGLAAAVVVAAAASNEPTHPDPAAPALAPLPFGVGEKLEYRVTFRFVGLPTPIRGRGVMEIVSADTVRGRETYHISFGVSGSALRLRVDDRYESWLDPQTMASRRFKERIRNPGYSRDRLFEIYPEEKKFREDSNPPQPSVDQPLDEGSFLYFIRTQRLEVGKTYTYPNYFRPDRNPVVVRVLRSERVHVANRDWDAIVIQPTIVTSGKGLFSKESEAEIWLAADPSRIILKLQSNLALNAKLDLTLARYTPAPVKP